MMNIMRTILRLRKSKISKIKSNISNIVILKGAKGCSSKKIYSIINPGISSKVLLIILESWIGYNRNLL
jgi:hypothetical protein